MVSQAQDPSLLSCQYQSNNELYKIKYTETISSSRFSFSLMVEEDDEI